uniref:Uncharacterized protein n=1 Tax=Cyprinodon variegatus TaxID=28743 RepID=A0A3Q2EFA1_CYPVA
MRVTLQHVKILCTSLFTHIHLIYGALFKRLLPLIFTNYCRFETKHGQIICSNPNNKWAKQVIRKMETEAISSGSSDQGE